MLNRFRDGEIDTITFPVGDVTGNHLHRTDLDGLIPDDALRTEVAEKATRDAGSGRQGDQGLADLLLLPKVGGAPVRRRLGHEEDERDAREAQLALAPLGLGLGQLLEFDRLRTGKYLLRLVTNNQVITKQLIKD